MIFPIISTGSVVEINKRTKDTITEILTEKIITGEIPGGYNLKQEELAKALGVSRIPIRETLMTLESLGLVYRKATRHFFTVDFSAEEIIRIFQVALNFELESIRNFNNEEHNEFEQLLAKVDKSYEIHIFLNSKIKNNYLKRMHMNLLYFIKTGCFECKNNKALFKNLRTLTDFDNFKKNYEAYYAELSKNLIRKRFEDA
ncbi:GntR family transcriptional regulator [Treponema phagedenis]|uniref:GntR family transcriptional regulator n=1 Tax=Treponema phagedenis TaxID=162 RepID=UPI0015820AA3|nr:GntR family transcriptional regulator [Treponema phagedenis]QKS91326.1 GntR family transcriptional regulator [Treponema phagedenis]